MNGSERGQLDVGNGSIEPSAIFVAKDANGSIFSFPKDAVGWKCDLPQ